MYGRMKKNDEKLLLVVGISVLAAFSRIIPHYPNLTPLWAIALIGAKYFKNIHFAILIPLVSIWVSDIIINNFILESRIVKI